MMGKAKAQQRLIDNLEDEFTKVLTHSNLTFQQILRLISVYNLKIMIICILAICQSIFSLQYSEP